MGGIIFVEAKELTNCRVCGSSSINEVLNLGNQELTGAFPKSVNEKVISGLLNLVFCNNCHLLQLGYIYPLDIMYGDNYGYRSGVNPPMVEHLSLKTRYLESKYNLTEGHIVLDIGSNDGTLLNSYSTTGVRKIGMDPTGKNFIDNYNDDVELISNFFSAEAFNRICDKKCKIVTSISMFYDLELPIDFAKQVESILENDGIWHLEQSYMPMMLRSNSYDTVCHEHLEYYSLSVLKYILESANMRIIDVSTNGVNGGSIAVTAAKNCSSYQPNSALIEWYLHQESAMELDKINPYLNFAKRTEDHRIHFNELLDALNKSGKTVCGYGASTKGNTVLQYCGITASQIKAIGDVTPSKAGCFTPGTLIPIDSIPIVKAMNPDYLVVLPWHYRNYIVNNEIDYLKAGGRFIFPLPFIEIV